MIPYICNTEAASVGSTIQDQVLKETPVQPQKMMENKMKLISNVECATICFTIKFNYHHSIVLLSNHEDVYIPEDHLPLVTICNQVALTKGHLHVARILMKHSKFDNSLGDAVFAACLANKCRIESLMESLIFALTQPSIFNNGGIKYYYLFFAKEKYWSVVDVLLLSGVPYTQHEDTMFEKELKQSLTNLHNFCV